MKKGISQYIPMKSKLSLWNTLNSNDLQNPEEINIFLDVFDKLKLNHEDINHLK
jgi:hypothetical protein